MDSYYRFLLLFCGKFIEPVCPLNLRKRPRIRGQFRSPFSNSVLENVLLVPQDHTTGSQRTVNHASTSQQPHIQLYQHSHLPVGLAPPTSVT